MFLTLLIVLPTRYIRYYPYSAKRERILLNTDSLFLLFNSVLYKTCFMCQFILNNRIYKVEKYDIETEIDDYLNKILSLLENLRDMETKVTFD